MHKDNTRQHDRGWCASAHASLCALGAYLRRIGFFRPLEEHVHIKQKKVKYTAVQKLEMLFVALLAGAKTVAQTGTTVRVDPALWRAFGLPGCAEQSVIAQTLDAATAEDVAALQDAMAEIFSRHSQARRHAFRQALLVLDVDLSPLPTSKHAEGATRGYMGRCRSKTGRKLVRVRAAAYQETVWEEVVPGNTAESLPVLQQALGQAERLLGLDGEGAGAQAKRARTEIRLDSAWGSDVILPWLLARGYQITGKFRSANRMHKLVTGIPTWQSTSSEGREVARVPQPVVFARPLAQYAVRTPSTAHTDGYYYAVVFTTRTDLTMQQVVEEYDQRASLEADIKADKRGLGLGVIRKRRLAAQKVVVLLMQLAHNVLVWARTWLSRTVTRLRGYGIVRLIQEIWAVPGEIRLGRAGVQHVRLRREHPRARDVCCGLRGLLASSPIRVILAYRWAAAIAITGSFAGRSITSVGTV